MNPTATTKTKPRARKKISGRTPATKEGLSNAKRRLDDAHQTDGTAGRQSDNNRPGYLHGVRMASVPISSIDVVENDRQTFDPDDLKKLADSIKRNGVLQPLVVTPVTADGTDGTSHGRQPNNAGRYRLIAGERRLRAAKLAGEVAVPVAIQEGNISAEMIREQRLAENIHRVDLTPIEKAQAIAGLLQTMTQKEASTVVGCTQGQISNTIRLLELPDIWQQWVAAGKLAPTAVRILLPFATKRPQVLQWLVDKCATPIDEGGFDLTEHMLREAIAASTRPLRQEQYNDYRTPTARDCWFKFDKKKHEHLDVEEINCSWAGPQLRAWNVEAWTELNKEPFRKVREKFAAAKAARTKSEGGSKKTGAVQPLSADPFKEHDLQAAITRDLLQMLATALQQKQHAAAVPLVYVYLSMTELGADLSMRLNELRKIKEGWLSSKETLKALSDVKGKAVQSLITELVVQTLRYEADPDRGWLPDGIDTPATVISIAKELVELDLLTSWSPSPSSLACCEEWFLRDVGRKALNLPLEDQPTTVDELHDWLEMDWPTGHVPAEMAKIVGERGT